MGLPSLRIKYHITPAIESPTSVCGAVKQVEKEEEEENWINLGMKDDYLLGEQCCCHPYTQRPHSCYTNLFLQHCLHTWRRWTGNDKEPPTALQLYQWMLLPAGDQVLHLAVVSGIRGMLQREMHIQSYKSSQQTQASPSNRPRARGSLQEQTARAAIFFSSKATPTNAHVCLCLCTSSYSAHCGCGLGTRLDQHGDV